MDEQLRRAERAAATGDPEAAATWVRLCARRGLFFKDYQPNEILTDWEETQLDYDEIWWHRRKCLRLDWDGDPINNGGLYKAHHKWGHRGWSERNAKRKTIRTHRDGSRKNYRLKEHPG